MPRVRRRKKSQQSGRPLNVRITQEAADIMARHPNKSEYIDEIIKKCETNEMMKG